MTNLRSGALLLRILTIGACAVVLSASECPLDDNTPDGDGGGGGTPATPTATTLVVVDGNNQTGTVGSVLTSPLVVQVNDQSGDAMAGVSVTFAVSTGGGSVGTVSAATGSDGRVSTTWTLGTTAGSYEVSASATGISSPAVFLATATAEPAVSISHVSGNGQNGFPNTALSNPIVIKVSDQHGNGVADVEVTFSEVSGGGSIVPGTVDTDASGNAQASWTLGPAIGANTATASSVGLTGSPIALTATATTLSVTAVSPDPLVEGATATITGTGFHLTPGNNTVTVDGAAATVTNVASATSMTISVPSFDCLPERSVDVVVSVSGFDDTYADHPLKPMSQLALSAGEQTIIENPTDFCLQFAASASGDDDYLIGVGSVSEIPSQVMQFSLSSVAGVAGAPPAMQQRPSRASASRPITLGVEDAALRQRPAEVEAGIRAYECQYLDPATNPGIRYLDGPAMGQVTRAAAEMAPAVEVGDQRVFRVPGTSCVTNDYAEITATARDIGTYGIWYTDDANPTNDSLTLADINSASATFDTLIYPFATDFFGLPSDVDVNSKIVIVMTKEVNKTGAAGFVYSGDLISRESCTYSDSGEIFYGFVPDPAAEHGYSYSLENVTDFLPVLISHEFTHNIQISRRRVILSGNLDESWLLEGQATLAEEVVGHASTGLSSGNDYGASEATLGPPYWYWQGISKLGYYFGGNSGTKISDAPENCTLFGDFSGSIGSCNQSAFYGASWSMLRYLTDRFYPGDEATFHQALISANPLLSGVENVEAVLGEDFDLLFAQWGAMLYVDNWVTNAPAELTMTSWDLPDVTSAVATSATLDPAERSFSTFSDLRSVRGGSHAYTLVSAAAGPRPALALRVRDAGDNVLGTSMLPVLWVVRVR